MRVALCCVYIHYTNILVYTPIFYLKAKSVWLWDALLRAEKLLLLQPAGEKADRLSVSHSISLSAELSPCLPSVAAPAVRRPWV